MKILTELQYKEFLQRVDQLVEEGFEQYEDKKNKFQILSKAIEAHEDIHYPMPFNPTNINLL